MKRLFDFLIALVMLIIFSPIILMVTVLVYFKLGSPIIFKQQRPGFKGKPFYLYKFRTMIDKKDKDGNDLPDSERLTSFGKLLRKLSLDELPQLWNVLVGDMSLVGPRPLLMRYMPYYTEREMIRFDVRPGITGWAQVNGRNTSSWSKRFQFDMWYVENWSYLLDLKILVLTVVRVFKSEGVITDAHSIMLNLDEERANR